jgi:hypothetical protein
MGDLGDLSCHVTVRLRGSLLNPSKQGAIALASVRRESGDCVDSIKAAQRRVGSTAPRLTTETDRSGLNG